MWECEVTTWTGDGIKSFGVIHLNAASHCNLVTGPCRDRRPAPRGSWGQLQSLHSERNRSQEELHLRRAPGEVPVLFQVSQAGVRKLTPGLARTASSLRQPSPLNPNRLASLPAHLHTLSTPRVPSPLGKGTPARQPKQSFPVRTSKTTERHVLLPEDPQLAPLPQSPIGSQVNLLPPPRPVAGPSKHPQQDERSDAEKMTKRERGEAGLPRLTAYATADGYRLKMLQAFLKREHGVGVVRVYDDCIYAVGCVPRASIETRCMPCPFCPDTEHRPRYVARPRSNRPEASRFLSG